MTLDDPEAADRNKKIFYDRIDNLVKHIEESLKRKKQVLEENKEAEKAHNSNKRRSTTSPEGKLQRLGTMDMTPIPV